MGLTVKAGLKPQPREFLAVHAHAHLDVFIDGKPVIVPSGIGIKVDDPAVQVDTLADGSMQYGGSSSATSRASRRSTRTTSRASSTPRPPMRSRTPSASSSPSGV